MQLMLDVVASTIVPSVTKASTQGDPIKLVSAVKATMLSRCPRSWKWEREAREARLGGKAGG